MTRVRVKVCGLRTPESIDAAVDAGADALGFVFAESPRTITLDQARALLERVPAFVQRVGVFLHPSASELDEPLRALPLDFVQTDADDFTTVAANVPGGRRLPVVRAGDRFPERIDAALRTAATALVEGPRSGAGERLDLAPLAALPTATRARLVIAGGLSPENVGEVIAAVRPFGVDVSSGVERSPGEKDSPRIRAFIRAVRAAAGELPSPKP